MKLIRTGIFTSLLLSIIVASSFSVVEDPSTTIVVVDGKALLVDIDHDGRIVTTYMEVPEYFNDDKDHKTKVLEATANYKRLTKAQMDQIRFIAIADDGWDLDDFMKSNLADLAAHYQQTYANQIEITAARNSSNSETIENNISRIKDILISHGVSTHDLVINYKIDLGDEPTRFIKVVSNLRSLASR